jgi:hypothetical protein
MWGFRARPPPLGQLTPLPPRYFFLKSGLGFGGTFTGKLPAAPAGRPRASRATRAQRRLWAGRSCAWCSCSSRAARASPSPQVPRTRGGAVNATGSLIARVAEHCYLVTVAVATGGGAIAFGFVGPVLAMTSSYVNNARECGRLVGARRSPCSPGVRVRVRRSSLRTARLHVVAGTAGPGAARRGAAND